MNICIIGTGYVGLVTGACFSKFVDKVYCVDIDQKKINDLNNHIVHIYEPGLNELIDQALSNNKIEFSCDLDKCIQDCDVCFITVGTPQKEDGSADLSYVTAAAQTIGAAINKPITVVQKSTVPVGTHLKIKSIIKEELENRNVNIDFEIVSNPEFLREGNAINAFLNPDRIVIGAQSDEAFNTMKDLYVPITKNNNLLIEMDLLSAEMTKYASNCMLASRISFINEMSNICEAVGADINKVRDGISSDKRIGSHFLHPSCGYGGSCFPKDVKAMIQVAKENNCDAMLLESVDKVNENQKQYFANKILKIFGNNLNGLTFAIWGLSFKADTDDMRGSAAIVLIKTLTKYGAKIKCYDPKAMDKSKNEFFSGYSNIDYCEDLYQTLPGAQALIIATEWEQFKNADLDIVKRELERAIVIDGRNIYDTKKMLDAGFMYYPIGIQANYDI